MSRWLFPWSGSIKKRACRYLLQRYLGHFLQERLSLDQLGLDLYNGSGVIKEINLDVWVSWWLSTWPRGSGSRCVFVDLMRCFATAHSSSTTISSVMLSAWLAFLRGNALMGNTSPAQQIK